MRAIVGGVGYRNLCDHSFGVLVIDALAGSAWPADVLVEDLSYGPIAVVQRLEDIPAGARPERAVFVSAVERAGRPAGTLTAYRWDGALPGVDEIQTAVAEAVTGVIAMDNTLIVARHFAVLPPEVIVVEVQPETHRFGDDLSAAVAQAFAPACTLVARAATERAFTAAWPAFPLGGGAPRVRGSFWPQVSDAWSRSR